MLTDILILLFCCVEIWNVPLRLALSNELSFYFLPNYEYLGSALIIIKMIVSLNTGIFIHGN